MADFSYEFNFLQQIGILERNTELVYGVDEVGRGCLAGPVVACCLSFKQHTPQDLLSQIQDSKTLSKKKRDYLAVEIKKYAIYGIATVDVETIDTINILQASLLCMKKAYFQATNGISPQPKLLLIDGNKGFTSNIQTHPLVDGDAKSLSIAGASIIAKVFRDNLMLELSTKYPYYGWEKNAGYGTKIHLLGIKERGITKHHRKTFSPIKNYLNSI